LDSQRSKIISQNNKVGKREHAERAVIPRAQIHRRGVGKEKGKRERRRGEGLEERAIPH